MTPLPLPASVLEHPHRPTPAEMQVLLSWWLIWSGSVLAVDGMEALEWFAIPADDWRARFAPEDGVEP